MNPSHRDQQPLRHANRRGFVGVLGPIERAGQAVLDLLIHIGSIVLLIVQALGIVLGSLDRAQHTDKAATIRVA
ncbi:MAG: hypothetical protein AAFN41_12595, partial [Planctomycetota bacterium]